jgi:ubiquinone/menaquinone biosynthesis C-methylase UbiE
MGVIKAEFEAVSSKFPPGRGFALDIGCGTSPYQQLINKKGYKYLGVDISIKSKKPNAVRADAQFLPFKNEVFDLVFNSHFLEHSLEPKEAIKEMQRVLKISKYIITLVPFMTPFHSNDYWRFTRLGLEHLFKELEIIEISVPSHVLTKGGHFLDVIFSYLGLKKLGNYTRNELSKLDKYLGRIVNFEGWAHSYIVVCKKI